MCDQSAAAAAADALSSRSRVAVMRRPVRRAGRVVIVGLALGLLAQLLFFDLRLGLNVPLFAATVLLAAWRLRPLGARLDVLDAWLPAGALLLTAPMALRGDSGLAAADLLAGAGLSLAGAAAVAGTPVTRRAVGTIAAMAASQLRWIAGGAVLATVDAPRDLAPSGSLGARLMKSGPVVRGLALATPLVLLFGILFASADPVFSRLVAEVLPDLSLGDLPGRMILAAITAYLVTGLLGWCASAWRAASAPVAAGRRGLGEVEAITLLIVLDVLFAIFVILQAAYLFGGQDTLSAAGLTYAEYARRGFLELTIAVVVVGAVVLGVEWLVEARRRFYVAAAVGLVALTGVVLVSAALRLALYQQAYGWTELRFWVAASIAWLALGLVIVAVAALTRGSRWVGQALVVAALIAGVTVNVIGPVHFVAEQNVARLLSPALVAPGGRPGLDQGYLATLDLDAVEPLMRALPQLRGPDRVAAEAILERWRRQLERDGADSWAEWNLSRARARDLLGVED